MPQAVSADLHQAGAVEAEAGLAAPQIGRAEEALGDRDEIGGDVVERREMLRRHVAAGGRHRETRLVCARRRDAPPSGSAVSGGSLMIGPGNTRRAQRRDPVGRRRPRRAERGGRQPADIAVLVRAGPRTSLRRSSRRPSRARPSAPRCRAGRRARARAAPAPAARSPPARCPRRSGPHPPGPPGRLAARSGRAGVSARVEGHRGSSLRLGDHQVAEPSPRTARP